MEKIWPRCEGDRVCEGWGTSALLTVGAQIWRNIWRWFLIVVMPELKGTQAGGMCTHAKSANDFLKRNEAVTDFWLINTWLRKGNMQLSLSEHLIKSQCFIRQDCVLHYQVVLLGQQICRMLFTRPCHFLACFFFFYSSWWQISLMFFLQEVHRVCACRRIRSAVLTGENGGVKEGKNRQLWTDSKDEKPQA